VGLLRAVSTVTLAAEPGPGLDRDEDLIRRHQQAVWRFVRWLGARPEVADDLTQEAFVRLLQQRRAGLGPPCDERRERAWLCTTAHNLFRNAKARARPGVPLDDVAALLAVFERHGAADDGWRAALDGCLGRLTERARAAVTLRYRQQLGAGEVGRLLGMKPAGVKGLLLRTRAWLARCLGAQRKR
jgi:RNA polymerase sigma-70 factor (ECF subfamily)